MPGSHLPNTSLSRNRARSKLAIVALITGLLCLAEFVGGWLSGSLALLSDAGHMLTDFLAVIVILLSLRWATKPADDQRTYGYYRVEVLASLFNGAFLLFIAFEILFHAFERMMNPREVLTEIMLPVAILGLLANITAVALLHKEHDHLATRSALFHIFGDLLSSVGVILGALIIRATGLVLIDPLISIVIALLIAFSAWKIIRETVEILLEASPKDIPLDKVRNLILQIEGVEDVQDLHVWTISSGFHAASAHILVHTMDAREGKRIIHAVSSELPDRFSIDHTTFQTVTHPPPAEIQKIS